MSSANRIEAPPDASAAADANTIAARPSAAELAEITEANDSGRPVVVFVHGLWLLSNSWASWRRRFEHLGYATLAPGWPGEPDSVEHARAEPDRMATNSLASVTSHYAQTIARLRDKPIIVGHSVGGLIAQQLAWLGLASCTVAISPAPGRGILRAPTSSLRSSWPVLRNPANHHRAVTLTFQQFRHAFASAVDVDEARRLYQAYVVPGPGRILFQSALANINPRTQARVDTTQPNRGPMKIIAGELDRIVPWPVSRAAYRRQQRSGQPTEYFEAHRRGHSLTIDNRWEGVADIALRFLHRFATYD